MNTASADLFGHIEEQQPFVDIRNQRESVAEEKARLCMELNVMCKRAPRFLSDASVQTVRAWQYAHKSAMKTLACKDSSRQQLSTAIESLRSYLPKETA